MAPIDRRQLAAPERDPATAPSIQPLAPELVPAAQTPTNLALGKPAIQSSLYGTGVASYAVDGNPSGGITHTQNNAQAWWQVDLGGVRPISTIAIWNRTDCCAERLKNFVVLVSDQPFVSTSLDLTQTQAGVSSYPFGGQAGRPTTLTINRTGRYVRVQLLDTNYLSLAEVEIFQGTVQPQSWTAQATTAGALVSAAPVDLIVPPWGATGTNDRIWRYRNGVWTGITPPQPGWYWVWLEVNPSNAEQWLLLGNTSSYVWRKFDVRNGFFKARGSSYSPAYYTPDAGATWLPVQLRHPTYTEVSSGTYSCADLDSLHWNTEPANAWTAAGFADSNCPNLSYAWFGTASTTAATVVDGPNTVSGQAFGPSLAGAGADVLFTTQYPGPAYLRVMSPGETSWTTPGGSAIGYYGAGQTMDRALGASREVALLGDANLYATPDYSQTQPSYRSIGYQGWNVTHAADGRWYLGGRAGGVVEINNLFSAPSAHVVVGGNDSVGFIRSDRATHTTVAARISDTSDHYVRVGADAWFRLAGPPNVPAGQLADRFEVLATSALPLDQARNGACACTSTSHPINTRSGNFWTETADVTVVTPGPALRWSRIYNSQAITETDSLLGPGWQHSYSARVLLPTPEPGNLLILSERGNLLRFTDHGNGSYTAFPGVEGTLTRDGGSLTYVLRDQSRRTFDVATGQLMTITDTRSRQLALSYTGTPPRLDRVQDTGTTARWLQLTYTPGGQIASVSDGSRTVGYSYDSAGDLVEARDVMDRPTTYVYQAHLLTRITNALGLIVEELAYDQYTPQGRAIQQVLQDGRQLELAYLPNTTVITTSATGQTSVQRYSYTSANTLSGVTTDDQATMAAIFDASFQPGIVSDGNGNRTSTRYQGNGLPVAQTDALGRTAKILYDAQNRPISTTDSLGITTLLSYDGRGNLLSTTTGITTTSSLRATSRYTYTYDLHFSGESLLQEQQGADGVVTRFEYNPQGQVSSRSVGFGTLLAQVTTYGYDAQGRVNEVVSGAGTPLARRDRTVYNADNTVAETVQNEQDGVFDPAHPDEDVRTRFGYDQLGRQVWTQDALGIYAATHYNPQGQVDWTARNIVPLQLDGSGQVILPSFDPATPEQNVARLIQYDGLGRTSLVTETGLLAGAFDPLTRHWSEAAIRATRIEYDDLSRPITTTLNYRPDQPLGTLPDVNVQLLQYYDGAGNVIWARDGLGRWTYTEYDALNRPVRITRNFVDGDPLTGTADTDLVTVQTYDGAGRLERQIENYLDGVFVATEPITDRITLFQYDTLNRVTSTTTNWAPGLTDPALNRVSSTSYDPATGRVLGQQDVLGRWVSQQYDALGRTTSTTQNCRVSGAAVPTGCAPFVIQ